MYQLAHGFFFFFFQIALSLRSRSRHPWLDEAGDAQGTMVSGAVVLPEEFDRTCEVRRRSRNP